MQIEWNPIINVCSKLFPEKVNFLGFSDQATESQFHFQLSPYSEGHCGLTELMWLGRDRLSGATQSLAASQSCPSFTASALSHDTSSQPALLDTDCGQELQTNLEFRLKSAVLPGPVNEGDCWSGYSACFYQICLP